jgi:hypothetical protein
MRFDDLASTRIQPINIKQTLRDELPYLLFYQVQPIAPDDSSDDPPPYTSDSGTAEASASSTPLDVSRANSIDPGHRSSLNIPSDAIAAATPARRGSLVSSVLAADDGPPAVPTAPVGPTTASTLSPPPTAAAAAIGTAPSSTNTSKRNSRIARSRSRRNSSSGEARKSATFSRAIPRTEHKENEKEKGNQKEVVAIKTDQRLDRKKIRKEKEREKRGKSRTRPGKVERGEERECLVM